MEYNLLVKHISSKSSLLFSGSYDNCIRLAHSLEAFSNDIECLEVYEDSENMLTMYKWKSNV